MICYYFPPITDVGSLRSIHFAKYFRQYGWRPSVLTVRNPDRAYCTVGDEVSPDGIHVERSLSVINPYRPLGKAHGLVTRLLKLFRIDLVRNRLYDLFCIPDMFWGWIPLTVLKAIGIVRRFNVDAIYVSCTPFSSALIGAFVKLRTKKPLIVDFRDPYALEERAEIFDVPLYRQNIDKRIERWVLNVADAFIVTTEETRNGYMRQYPEFTEKMYTVYNGFDMADASVKSVDKYDKFTIIYTGDFYLYTKKNELFAEAFFDGLSRLMERRFISPDTFQFLFYGDGFRMIEQLAHRYGVCDVVHVSGRISRKSVIEAIEKSHFSLLRIVSPMISTKLFEGISLNTPFIATIPHGEAEAIIRKYSPGSYVITEATGEAVAASITEGMERYRKGDTPRNDLNGFSDHFSRERGAQRMMKIIDNVIGRAAQ
ncbi:MAG: glycosyltransferase [Syntrophales bacterium]|nr:glycosyltransferase [Syntrophales bacterium]